jgi:ABC-type uncharacterized transport system substrate-binding protein
MVATVNMLLIIATLEPENHSSICETEHLVQLGYREDQDFFLGVRFTQGNREALPIAARELVDAGAAILFTDSNATADAAQHATTDIPIVFAGVEDPVGAGLITSFAQPGGNMTGIASLDTELGPKRLQLFHALVPTLKRVLFLYAANDIYAQQAARSYRWAAQQLGIVLVEKVVRTEEEGFCRKFRFWGQNPKTGSLKFNRLQTPKLSQKQICDRTDRAPHRLYGGA